ncbi:MAG: alkaline phosphatase family protein, partial [Candidatus Nanohaloarchaea archaeon]
DKIKAYDQKPEMHADDITDILVDAIGDGEHDFIMLNFPNGDLVGHTGKLDAAITAMETIDRNIGRIVETVDNSDYALVLTADHGNCEDMGTPEDPNTSHTLNEVPMVVRGADSGAVEKGELWEVAKVVEDLMELD